MVEAVLIPFSDEADEEAIVILIERAKRTVPRGMCQGLRFYSGEEKIGLTVQAQNEEKLGKTIDIILERVVMPNSLKGCGWDIQCSSENFFQEKKSNHRKR